MGKSIHRKLCFGCGGDIEVIEDYCPGPYNRIMFESSMRSGWHPECKKLFDAGVALEFAEQMYRNLPED